jgi:TolB-like protein/Flp pilus assembly protein TadD
MSHVFVSYKKDDRRLVQRLVDGLIAEGLTVWWDVRIEGGAAWREEIRNKLEAAACVVVVWSKASVGAEGHFVQDEAAYADRRGVYLPVAIDDVAPPLGFGQQQVIDLRGWRGNRHDRRFAELLESVRGMLAGAVAAKPEPREADRPTRPTSLYAAAIAVAILTALTIAALIVGPELCSSPSHICGPPPFLSSAKRNSIAVLPFANLSGDPAQDYFSDGLSDELLSRLARIPQLQVSARTSSFKFKGARDDSRSIGVKLGVNYILDGSVRRDGNVIRVSAQLVEARTGFERWSQTYDRDFKDIFAVQSDIADAVAQALRLKLGVVDEAAIKRSGATNPLAYDDYLKGLRLFGSGGGELSHRDALARFDAAIAADPRFAAAYSARARTLLFLANQFLPASALRAAYDDAIASARRAVELDPQLAEAQATLADTLVFGTRDFPAAKLAYQRALSVGGTGNAEVLLRYGQFECVTGDIPDGLAALRKAVTLDPLNARAYSAYGLGLIYARQYPAAEAAMRQALRLSPAINGARAALGEAMLLLGRAGEAKSEYALEPESWQRLSGQAIVFRRLGDTAAADAALATLVATDGDTSSYQIAEVYAQWGRLDAAFAALDTALKVGDPGLQALKVDPLLDPLRRDARFNLLLRRTGLND